MNVMNGPSSSKPHSSLFSRFFSSSHNHNHSSSMQNVPLKHRPLPQTLLNDPAFSTDPNAHPLHPSVHASSSSPSHEINGGTPASIPDFNPLMIPPGHPLFKKDQLAALPARRPPLPPITVSRYIPSSEADEIERDALRLPLQPPNTPQTDGPAFPKQPMQFPRQVLRSDNREVATSIPFPFGSPQPSNFNMPKNAPLYSQNTISEPTSASSSSVDSTPSTTPPSSAGSHSPNKPIVDPAMATLPAPVSPIVEEKPKAEKRNRTFSFFRRKPAQPSAPLQPQPPSPTKSRLTKPAQNKPLTDQPIPPTLPPSHVPNSGHRPVQARGQSVPELVKQQERPMLPTRPATSPSQSPDVQTSQPSGPPVPTQVRGLDRIDELDETNPFGAHVHHGGPYEAISRLVGGGKQHDRSNVHLDQSHKASKQSTFYNGSGTSSVSIPQSTSFSLNIVPGQVIPRDFTFGRAPLHPTINMQINRSIPYPGGRSRDETNYRRGPSSDPGHDYTTPPRPTHRSTLSDRLGISPAASQPPRYATNQQVSDQALQTSLSPQSQSPPPPRRTPPPPPTSQHAHLVLPAARKPEVLAKPLISESASEFDPYASYSPTVIPRHLDEPGPPPMTMPTLPPPQGTLSKPAMMNAVKSEAPRASPPLETPPQSSQLSVPSSSLLAHPHVVESPSPTPSQNSRMGTDQPRRPSPVSSQHGSERDAYGGIDEDEGLITDRHSAGHTNPKSQDIANQAVYGNRSKSNIELSESHHDQSNLDALPTQNPSIDVKGNISLSYAREHSDPRIAPAPAAVTAQQLDGSPLLQLPANSQLRTVPGVPASSSSSIRTGVSRSNRGLPPKMSHLPKRLVMPAPLQQQQQLPPPAGFGYQHPPNGSHPVQPRRYHSPQRYSTPQTHPPTQHSHSPVPQNHGYTNDMPYEERRPSQGEQVQFQVATPFPEPQRPYDPREHLLRSPPPTTPHPFPTHNFTSYVDQRQLQPFSQHSPHPQQINQHPQYSVLPSGVPRSPDRLVALEPTRPPPAQQVAMPPERKVLRKKSTIASKDHGTRFPGIGSSESIPGVVADRGPVGKELTAKERAKMEKKEREREQKEQKEREKIRQREEKAMGQRIPKRVLSKRRNDI